jgi:D-glycero-D-manno-heptose 1,7-bisphosphate phosphatase
MQVAVFLERDGVLNKVRVDRRQQISPMNVGEFELIDGVSAALRELKRQGFILIVTTNQPGISRGSQSRRELDLIHDQIRRLLPVDDILMCPHDDVDGCPCRKPKPGLLLEAAYKWHLDLDHSYVVSDKWQDAEAAQLAGCTSLLIKSGWNGTGHHDMLAPTLQAAANKIIQRNHVMQSGEGWTMIPTHATALRAQL